MPHPVGVASLGSWPGLLSATALYSFNFLLCGLVFMRHPLTRVGEPRDAREQPRHY
jgi:hypothetical protein